MSSPTSKPIAISPPHRSTDNSDNNGLNNSNAISSTPIGTPDLNLRALRARYGGTPPIQPIPPFNSSPSRSQTQTPRRVSNSNNLPRPALGTSYGAVNTGSATPANLDADLADLPDEEKAKIIRRHLVSRQERQNKLDNKDYFDDDVFVGAGSGPHSGSNSPRPSNAALEGPSADDEQEPFPIPYDAPGGDITAPIYKWQSNADPPKTRRRSISYAGPSTERPAAFAHIHQPGGFRRNYLLLKSDADNNGGSSSQNTQQPQNTTNNFIEFLYLFGHFAGEDLEEIEEEEEEEEEEEDVEHSAALQHSLQSDVPIPGSDESPLPISTTGSRVHKRLTLKSPISDSHESSPLLERSQTLSQSQTLRRSISRRRTRSMSTSAKGDASVGQATLMMLKCFIGTGVLFLGKAFYNGGIIFSFVTVAVIALVSLYSFLLLTDVKWVIGGSFGDMGGTLYGRWMRRAILFSITLSQIGFVCAYMIFISSNIEALIKTVSSAVYAPSKASLPLPVLILLAQVAVLYPLSLVRNLARLSFTALIADVFILLGLLYIYGSEVAVMVKRGVQVSGWKGWVWNSQDWPLLVGTAVFSFEGVGLVIPVTDAMREPRKFPAVLTGVMIFLLFLFGGSGMMSYLAFGPDIQPTVIINLPQDSKMVQAVQVIYSLAILLSAPIQLFPAIRIMETKVFGTMKSGKMDVKVKWQKNAFRLLVVVSCAVIAGVGAQDLDKFVAFVGCFACLPLCFIYPALLHLKACANTTAARVKDYTVLVFGVIVCVYSTVQTIKLTISPET